MIRHSYLLRIFLIVPALSGFIGLTAQYQFNFFDHYGPGQGLKTSQVLSMAKDTGGYLWLGTENGLARFDAHVFRYYHHDFRDSLTLSGNYISDIACDKHNRLWISTGHHLNLFDPATGEVTRMVDSAFVSRVGKINQFYYDAPQDAMWIATSDGLFKSQGKQIRFRKVEMKGVDGAIHDLQKKAKNQWVLAGDKALFIWDEASDVSRVFHHGFHKEGFDDGFLCVMAENDSIIWGGSWVHGLVRVNVHNGKVENFTYRDARFQQNGILDIAQIPGREDKLFLATTDGVQVFDKKSGSFTNYRSDNVFDPKSIPGAGFTFLEDQGSLWMGTYQGLHKWDRFKNIIGGIPISTSSGFDSHKLQDICFERMAGKSDSLVWLSYPYQSVIRYDLVNRREAAFPASIDQMLRNKTVGPYSMMVSRDNVLWLSAEKWPLLVCDLKSGQRIGAYGSIFPPGPFLEIIESRDKRIWLATEHDWYIADVFEGKFRFTHQSDIPKKLRELNPNLIAQAYIFTLDQQNGLWFLAWDSRQRIRIPVRFDLASRQIRVFDRVDFPDLPSLGLVDGINALSDGTVCISGIHGFGFITVNGKQYTFKRGEARSGLSISHSHHMVEDASGNLILSTDFGFAFYQRKEALFTHYTYYNSSLGNRVQPPLVISPISGTLYIGQKGFLNVLQTGYRSLPAPAKLKVSSLRIANHSPVIQVSNGQRIRLQHHQNEIELSLTNLVFTNADQSGYYYRWSDEDDWKRNASHTFYFNNLSPGDYHLQFKSANAYGVFGGEIFSLYFLIDPPFYRAWWFYLLLMASALIVIVLVARYRHAQRKKLEKIRHAIARDLHDDLGSSLSYIRILSESEGNKAENNRSFRLISEKTAEVMNNMSEIVWSINPDHDSFFNVAMRIQDFAIDTLEPLGIHLKFEIDTLPERYKLSPEARRQYYLIFKEAINNAAKYAKATTVVLIIKLQGQVITTLLQDDGIGFDGALITRGNGLKNMKSRADALGARLEIVTGDTGTSVRLDLRI